MIGPPTPPSAWRSLAADLGTSTAGQAGITFSARSAGGSKFIEVTVVCCHGKVRRSLAFIGDRVVSAGAGP